MPMMSVSDAVKKRRSVRAFLDRPVAFEVLREIMDVARLAPSGCNFQPWEATILTGAPLRALQRKLQAATPQSPVEYDIVPREIEAEFIRRQQEMTALMFGAMGVARDDADGRMAAAMANLTSFGAPVLLLCYIPRVMGPPQWSDVGMWLQTVMLLAQEQGLDTVPQEFMALHGRVIKEHIGVDDSRYILFCGMGIGYRDEAAPVNNFERARMAVGDHVKFAGF